MISVNHSSSRLSEAEIFPAVAKISLAVAGISPAGFGKPPSMPPSARGEIKQSEGLYGASVAWRPLPSVRGPTVLIPSCCVWK